MKSNDRGAIILAKKSSEFLFNLIAPVYSLFYTGQQKRFSEIIENTKNILDLTSYKTVLDVGCGTGALCAVLADKGMSVTGVDSAEQMLSIAVKRLKNKNVSLIRANALQRLPFDDKSFDISIAAYVAHGLKPDGRKHLYTELARVSRYNVIIHDYNQNRSVMTTIIEGLERGDYFRFIRNAEAEMKNCVSTMKECFYEVKMIDVDVRAAWYICTPK